VEIEEKWRHPAKSLADRAANPRVIKSKQLLYANTTTGGVFDRKRIFLEWIHLSM
jgi:hypothetical protein